MPRQRQILNRLMFVTGKLGEKEKPSSSQGNQEGIWVVEKLLPLLIPSTAKHWAVILFFYDYMNNRFFRKVVEIWDDNGRLKASVKDYSKDWQKKWEAQTDVGENEWLPEFTMIDKALVGEPYDLEILLRTRILYDCQRLETFVKMFNDANYAYNTFNKNCQWFVDCLLLELNLKPIQRLLPWSLDFIVTLCMLVSTNPFLCAYWTSCITYSLFSYALLMFALSAAIWIVVFLLRDTFGPCQVKYLLMCWIHIECFIFNRYDLVTSLVFFNTQWVTLFMAYFWYRFFRLIVYGNVLHYPKCYSWFSNVSQNLTQNY